MKCSCGNMSRFEIYRAELVRHITDFRLVNLKIKIAGHVIENSRAVYTGPILCVRCIKCGAYGPSEFFNLTAKEKDFLREESIEGFGVPMNISHITNGDHFAKAIRTSTKQGG